MGDADNKPKHIWQQESGLVTSDNQELLNLKDWNSYRHSMYHHGPSLQAQEFVG